MLALAQIGQLPVQNFDNYSQWKLALQNDGLTSASFSVPEGFKIEAVRVATPEEGSWISLAFDPKGRLVVGREKQGLMRFTLDDAGRVTKTELINDTVQEARGLLFAHDSLYVTANREKNIYRLQDINGDDQFDKVEVLKNLAGGTGHGRNGMALGPDGKIYIACGNNVLVPKDRDPKSPYLRADRGRLLPCYWNEFLFDSDVVPPCGWVGRFDKDGKNWETVAGGFRNPYDLAFNEEGDLFTYDADMEWDVGAPWYRPTTVAHVVPGGEYGWRQGSDVWPDHFPDALPRVCDIGLGSPTGVAFGTKSKFPPKLQKALFICDWAYGRIMAVNMSASGSTYKGKPELFLQGKPMNVADITFGPDGAMWFVVGGRGTRSAVYRVSYRGEDQSDPVSIGTFSERLLRQTRRKWESLRPDEVEKVWDTDAKTRWADLVWDAAFATGVDVDAHLRNAARRVALQATTQQWEMILKRSPRFSSHLALAVALRADEKTKMIEDGDLAKSVYSTIPGDKKIAALRSIQLRILRTDKPSPSALEELRGAIEAEFPYRTFPENQLAIELLVYLDSSKVANQTLTLLFEEEKPDRKLFYLFALRSLKSGWDKARRLEQLSELKQAETFPGAQYMPTFITYIRSDTLASFSPEHREALKNEIAELGKAADVPAEAVAGRPKVKDWTLPELTAAVEAIKRPADLKNGKKLYVAAQCSRCHRLGEQGKMLGPDLTNVSSRFSRQALLESIVEPSKVIDDKYRSFQILTTSGQAVTGQYVGGDAESLFVAGDPLNLSQFQVVKRKEIESRKPSPISIMPAGLANVLTADDVYDLLSYIEQVK